MTAVWEEALAAFAADAAAARLNPATTAMRVRTGRAFAAGLDLAPFDVSREVFQARLAQLPQSPTRTAMRAFYRWALRTGRIQQDPSWEPSKLPQAQPAPEPWRNALSLFEAAHRAVGYEDSTVDLRMTRLRLFAAEMTTAPWQLTWEEYRARLDSLPVSKSTRATYRTALRAFYRWAFKTGRVEQDPTAEPSLRVQQLKASPEWEAELLAYTRHLRALGRSENSTRVRRSQLRRLAREMPHTAPYSVTTDDLLELLASFRWESETRHSHASALRSFYGWARKTKRTKRDPAKHIPPIRVVPKLVEPAPLEVYREALAKAEPRERLALQLACELGLRRGEVVQIRHADVTGGPGSWWLLVHGKGSKQRRVPLSDELAGALRTRGTDWVFPGNFDGHLSAMHLGKRIADLLPPGVTMHKLRHRFATDAYAVDHDLLTVQLLLGHSSPNTTRRYVRTPDQDLRSLVSAVALGQKQRSEATA